MTLDLRKYLENLIKREAKISHFAVKVSAGKTNKLKGNIVAEIKNKYGELFLNDANYILFFTKQDEWTDKDIQKLFDLTDRALGKDANKLSKSDFKKLEFGNSKENDIDDLDDMDSDEMQEPMSSVQTTLFVKVTLK